jgi:hypothetical protein
MKELLRHNHTKKTQMTTKRKFQKTENEISSRLIVKMQIKYKSKQDKVSQEVTTMLKNDGRYSPYLAHLGC